MTTRDDLPVTADRDSVCAGDDCESHAGAFIAPRDGAAFELIEFAADACNLASISGGKATWIVDLGGTPIAVYAEQWKLPKLLVPENAKVAEILDGRTPRIYFRYLSQVDPDAVFAALRNGTPLPS